jgi:hypothetical protein
VSTWKRRNPDHQPLICSADRHLWSHGLALAIYHKAGQITRGGEEPRTFFAHRETLAKFFDASYNATCNAMSYLVKEKWLTPTEKEKHYLYVPHEKYIFQFTGDRCAVRELVPYQEGADPLVKRLFAVAQGSLRVKEHWVVGLRKHASDDEIVELFIQQRKADIARRKSGDGFLTGPNNSLYAVLTKLQEAKAEAKLVPSSR